MYYIHPELGIGDFSVWVGEAEQSQFEGSPKGSTRGSIKGAPNRLLHIHPAHNRSHSMFQRHLWTMSPVGPPTGGLLPPPA